MYGLLLELMLDGRQRHASGPLPKLRLKRADVILRLLMRFIPGLRDVLKLALLFAAFGQLLQGLGAAEVGNGILIVGQAQLRIRVRRGLRSEGQLGAVHVLALHSEVRLCSHLTGLHYIQ